MSPPTQSMASVLGGAETGIVAEDSHSISEMVLDVVEKALEDASLAWADIDATVTASVDLFDGLTASSIAVTEVVGAVMKPETRIAADGLVAAIHAVHQIQAGAYRRVLVVAHGKASMAPHWTLTEWALDPILLQPLGVDFLTIAGLQANLVTGTDAIKSPPLGDAACAIILGPSETDDPTITGTGHDLDHHYPGDRDLTEWAGLRRACARAYAQAGITHPENAFSVVEASLQMPHEEALFIDASQIGTLPPGGISRTAPVISGLTRLRRAAQAVDADRAARALAHGAWGPAGQGQAVAVVERR